MVQIVEFIDKVILNFEDEKVLAEIANQVNEMMVDFPIFSK